MKKISLLIFLSFSIYLSAQEAYLKIPDMIFDKTTINRLVDSLKNKKKVTVYIVYQKQGKANNIVSYLICNLDASVGLWVISKDTILEYKTLNAKAIFSYKDIALTGATKQEDKLNFKPPMLSVIDNEVVIYCNNKRKMKFYFEYGDNITTYEPLPEKEICRKKWIDIIRNIILLQEQQ
jgi:hypothetical protein